MSAEDRRSEVILAATIEFSHGGLHGTSTDDIARRAGISQPYLFRLFPTKKALFLAAVEHTFERSRAILLDSAEELSGEEALAAMGQQYTRFVAERTLLLTQLHAFAACDDEEVRSVVGRCFARTCRAVAERAGVDEEALTGFVAMGMLCNVAAAMDLPPDAPLAWLSAPKSA